MKTPVKTGVSKGSTKTTKAETTVSLKVEKSNSTAEEILKPSADFRIKKLKTFQILADKHDFLKNKFEELENFLMSCDGTNEKITLSNGKGFEFTASNSQVVEEVTEVLKTRLKVFIEHSEKQILEFTI